MLSVIIPSYKDPLLQKTIDSLLDNAEGDIEVIAAIDGDWLTTPIKKDKRVRVLYSKKIRGMKGAINEGLAASKGDYVMKSDSHCIFGKGFDKIMTENCAENWMVTIRAHSLDEGGWKIDPTRPYRDYFFMSFPEKERGSAIFAKDWRYRTRKLRDPKYDIDDTMAVQGSCWLANKKYFIEHVGFMDDNPETCGSFAGEQLELGLKYWLNGGEVKMVKKTWYAHLSKRPFHYRSGLYDRSYKKDPVTAAGHIWSTKHWIRNEEPGMTHPFSWIIEKFWPIPGWPDNWKEALAVY